MVLCATTVFYIFSRIPYLTPGTPYVFYVSNPTDGADPDNWLFYLEGGCVHVS